MRYNMVLSSDGDSTIVLTDDDLNTTVIEDSHPNFVRIVEALRNGDDVEQWLNANPAAAVAHLSDRVTVVDGVLHFDGEAVYNGLSQTIMRYSREGREVHNLVRFMERLSNNPSYRSREQLFTWTEAKEMVIDADGFIIGFKGVRHDMLSVHSGSAMVDGTLVEGRIPNLVGTVISMPRSGVQDDPNKGCSTGLHVGNWSYASSFGDIILEVRLDPADVVSVPADCSYRKLRCCRYEVIAIHETDDDDLSDYEPESTWDEEGALDDFDSFMEYAPPTFTERLLAKFRRRGGE